VYQLPVSLLVSGLSSTQVQGGREPSSSGFAKIVICGGRTSGTPPTAVATTYKPQEAASTMTVPNASVKLGCK